MKATAPVLAFTNVRDDDPLTPQTNAHVKKLTEQLYAAERQLAARLELAMLGHDPDGRALESATWGLYSYWQRRALKTETALKRVLEIEMDDDQRALADQIVKGAALKTLPARQRLLPVEVEMVMSYRKLDDATRAAFRTMIDRLVPKDGAQ